MFTDLEDYTQTLAERTALLCNSERSNIISAKCVTRETIVIQQKMINVWVNLNKQWLYKIAIIIVIIIIDSLGE